jgi:hypothetical protein
VRVWSYRDERTGTGLPEPPGSGVRHLAKLSSLAHQSNGLTKFMVDISRASTYCDCCHPRRQCRKDYVRRSATSRFMARKKDLCTRNLSRQSNST